MFKWLSKLFSKQNKHSCTNCGGAQTTHSWWIRGYNNYCRQAYDDKGYYCNECSNIDFDKTLDEHLKTLPKWCTPYK